MICLHTPLIKIPLLLIVIITIAGCSKNNSTALFQFQANGTAYSFDSVTSSIIDTSAGVAIAGVRLYNTKTTSTAYFELQSNTTKLPGTYSHINPTTAGLILVNFDYTLVQGSDYKTYTVEGTVFTLTVTAVRNGNMQGYFSGKINFVNTTTDATITNGQFKIPFNYQ